jgi:hypothetical protein
MRSVKARAGTVIAIVGLATLGVVSWLQQAEVPYRFVAGPPALTTEPVRNDFVIDFTGAASERNLRFARGSERAKAEAFFEEPRAHTLQLANFGGKPISLTSYNTFIEYVSGELRYLNIYLAPDLVPYSAALRLLSDFMAHAGIGDRFDVQEYEKHLGELEGTETWVQVMSLEHVKVWPMLNCNWDWPEPASTQLERVGCRPFLSIEPLSALRVDAGAPP